MIEDYQNKVGYSERGNVPIEPYLSEQWFMNMGELAKPAVEVVQQGKVKFIQSTGKKHIPIGWKAFEIGVFPVNFGGGIEFLFGTTTQQKKFIVILIRQKIYKIGDRTKMFLIPGHQAGCGHTQYLKLKKNSNIIIQQIHL